MLVFKKTNQNTEVKTEHFAIWTTQNNVHNVGIAYVAFNKATGRQTDILFVSLLNV